MRALCLSILIVVAGGCFSTAPPPRVQYDARIAADARADSLLALPSDSLKAGDVAWLSAYAARQSSPEGRATQRGQTVFAVLGILALVGGVFALWSLQDASGGG